MAFLHESRAIGYHVVKNGGRSKVGTRDEIHVECQFDTDRLTVRSWDRELSDTVARRRLVTELESLLDPQVLAHLPPSLQRTEGTVEDWIGAAGAESRVHTVRCHEGSRLVGLLILAHFPDEEALLSLHLGYLFAVEAWGNGYATELVTGLVSWSAGQSFDIRITGGVGKDNPASAAVLRKAGFERSAALSTSDTDMFERMVSNTRKAF